MFIFAFTDLSQCLALNSYSVNFWGGMKEDTGVPGEIRGERIEGFLVEIVLIWALYWKWLEFEHAQVVVRRIEKSFLNVELEGWEKSRCLWMKAWVSIWLKLWVLVHTNGKYAGRRVPEYRLGRVFEYLTEKWLYWRFWAGKWKWAELYFQKMNLLHIQDEWRSHETGRKES